MAKNVTGGPQPVPDDVGTAAIVDKESARQIVMQLSGFIKIFGGGYPRLRSAAVLLDAISEPAMWDKIWAVFESNPATVAALQRVGAMTAADQDPAAVLAACRKAYANCGEPFPEQLARAIEEPHTAKSEEYWRFKRGVAAALATIQMWGIFLGSKTFRGYVDFIVTMFSEHFDEVWAIEHPNDV